VIKFSLHKLQSREGQWCPSTSHGGKCLHLISVVGAVHNGSVVDIDTS